MILFVLIIVYMVAVVVYSVKLMLWITAWIMAVPLALAREWMGRRERGETTLPRRSLRSRPGILETMRWARGITVEEWPKTRQRRFRG